MRTFIRVFKFLPKYFSKALEVWVIWIWFFALDVLGLVIDTFVPEFSPPRWWYWLIAAIGFVLANVRLLLDCDMKLAAYEFQAPLYDIEVTDVMVDVCDQACHVNVYCDVCIKATTPWIGYLVKVDVIEYPEIEGLGSWEVDDVSYKQSYGHDLVSMPLQIPDSTLNLQIKFRSEVDARIYPPEDNGGEDKFSIGFIIEYHTQPIGDVQRLDLLEIQADLEEALTALQH